MATTTTGSSSAPAGTASSRRRSPRPAPPAQTLILFVRHGTTPTTGKVLPGRAKGLHLAESGIAQAKAAADRIATWAGPPGDSPAGTDGQATAPPSDDAGTAGTDGTRARSSRRGRTTAPAPRPRITAVYASPLERTRETAAPIAARLGLRVVTLRGLIECDFGEWTGASLADLAKRPEWTTVQRYPSGFRFPGGESFSGMQARMADTVTELCRRHPGEAIVAVSHADPIKAVVADALGTHLDLFQRIAVSPASVTAIAYGAAGPTVLAVNSTGSLTELRPS